MKKDRHKRFLRNADGAVAATYALALIPLIAFAGLAFDYTRVVGMDTELQNAADQAALAGASQLDRSAGSMQRAINAAQGALVINFTGFANDGNRVSIENADLQICFYRSREEAENEPDQCFPADDGITDADAGFIQVTVDPSEANFAFTPIVGSLTRGTLNASAVAGLGSALCRIPPLMICNPDESSGATRLDVENRRGQGVLAKPGGGSGGWGPGNYGYLDIGPNGATGIRQALGWDASPGNCVDVTGTDVLDETELETQTGNVASGPQAVNTRFDVYEQQGCVGSGTCSSAYNARKDLMRPANIAPLAGNSCSIHSSGWQEPLNAYHPTSNYDWTTNSYAGTIDSMGHPRDVCHAVEGAGACAEDRFGDGEWDRDAYFRTHYVRGAATGNGGQYSSWTRTDWTRELNGALFDLDEDGSPDRDILEISRYEVYLWEQEKAQAGAIVDGVQILGDTPLPQPVNTEATLTTRNRAVCAPILYPPPTAAPPDRRLMSVGVVNCQAEEGNLNGKVEVPIAHFVDIFLVQPSYDRGQAGKFTKKDEIYVEIVRETEVIGTGSVSGPTVRRDVPYLVR